ncbi:unnamed protein product [Mucor hiemalis]
MLRIKARDEFAVKQEIKTAKKKWNATLGAKERDQRYQKIQKTVVKPQQFLCLVQAKNVKLHSELINNEIMMSGIDNGVISMTEIVSFDLNKFKFHCKLFNLFCNLRSEDEVFFDDEDKAQLALPKSIVLRPEVAKNLYGGFKADSWLNRRKRNEDGILEI